MPEVMLSLSSQTSAWLQDRLDSVPNHNMKYHAADVSALLRKAREERANSMEISERQAKEVGFFMDDCLRDLVSKARHANRTVPRPLDAKMPWPTELQADLDQAKAVLADLGCKDDVFMDEHYGNWNHRLTQRD